jgi:hypothetical protein
MRSHRLYAQVETQTGIPGPTSISDSSLPDLAVTGTESGMTSWMAASRMTQGEMGCILSTSYNPVSRLKLSKRPRTDPDARVQERECLEVTDSEVLPRREGHATAGDFATDALLVLRMVGELIEQPRQGACGSVPRQRSLQIEKTALTSRVQRRGVCCEDT